MIQQTLEKMKRMKLYGMQRSFRHATETGSMANLTPDELIHLLVENEWDDRQNRSMERNLRGAKFRYKATVEELDFRPGRELDKNQLLRLADGAYIKKGENILLTGSTGTVKSPPSSPPSCPSRPGMKSSATTPWQMPFWTESYTTPTASNYRENPCGNNEKSIPKINNFNAM